MMTVTSHNSVSDRGSRVSRRALLVTLCVFGLATVLVRAQDDPRERATLFSAHLAAYYGGFYDTAPVAPARWVFYRGETIEGSVGFQNEARHTMLAVTVPGEGGFRAEWVRIPDQARGLALPLPAAKDGIRIDIGAAAQRVFPNDRVIVPPGASIATGFSLETQQLPVGLYQLVLHPDGWQTDRRALPGWNTMTFEIRNRSELPSALDALAREVRRAMATNDFTQANALANEMLARHKDSVFAYSLRAQIASKAGRKAEADEAKAIAGQIVREHRDSLYESRPRSAGIQ